MNKQYRAVWHCADGDLTKDEWTTKKKAFKKVSSLGIDYLAWVEDEECNKVNNDEQNQE